MDTRLMEAAQSGDVGALKSILEKEPSVLQRASSATNTPLHVATLARRTDFVREIVRVEPSLAWKTNEEGLSPLHIASGIGHRETLRELLEVSPDLCFIKDNGGRTPLHYAAMKGRPRIIPDLHAMHPSAARETTAKGETVFHLAVTNNHYNAVKVLLEELGDDAREILKAKDREGRTVMHIATSRGQSHMMKLISWKDSEEEEDEGDKQKDEKDMGLTEKGEQRAQTIFHNMSARLDEMAPIVASLISSMTYSSGLSPPKTLWKDNMKLDPECIWRMYGTATPTPKLSDPSQLCPSRLFLAFISFNTAGFLSAILLIFLYSNTQVARILLTSALIFLTMTYLSLTITMAPHLLAFLIVLTCTIASFALALIAVALFRTAIKHLVALIVFLLKKTGVV